MFMKRLLIFSILFACIYVCTYSQNKKHVPTSTQMTNEQLPLQELINDYVEATIKKQDATSCLSRLNIIYKQKKPKEQTEILKTIYDTITKMQEEGKNKETLALIDLYQSLAKANDDNLPLLIYIKGDIYAEQGDTIVLKECIGLLKNITAGTSDYSNNLQSKLTNIQNEKPLEERLEGVWISTNRDFMRETDGLISPYIMRICRHNGTNSYRLEGTWGDKLENSYKGNDETRYAQNVSILNRNELYLAWSAEKLKAPSKESVEYWTGFTSEISNVVTEKASSLDEMILGGLFSTVVSTVVDIALTPSKRIYVIQSKLEMLNSYELIAHVNCKSIYIYDSEKPSIIETNEDVHFVKWNSDYGVFLLNDKLKPIDITISENSPLSGIDSQELARSQTLIKKGKKKEMLAAYNYTQIMKVAYLNEKQMRKENLFMSERCHKDNSAVAGFSIQDGKSIKNTAERMYNIKLKIPDGISVSHLNSYLPGVLYGLKENDEILKIDGYDISGYIDYVDHNGESYMLDKRLRNYIGAKEPFTRLEITIRRKNKIMNIPIELGYLVRIKELSDEEYEIAKKIQSEITNKIVETDGDVDKDVKIYNEIEEKKKEQPIYQKYMREMLYDSIM